MNSKVIVFALTAVALALIVSAIHIDMANATLRGPAQPSGEVAETNGNALVCLDCHRSPNINSNEGVHASNGFCFDCHKERTCVKTVEKTTLVLQVTPEAFNENRHQFIACIACHQDVAKSPHETQTGALCLDCHGVHGESAAHSPHLRVSCQACHFKSEFVARNPENDTIGLAHVNALSVPISLTDHALADTSDNKNCEKCHHTDNQVGASAAVLPAKGTLCIICHYSPLSMGHPIFAVASLIFLAGILLTLRFWYQGSVQGEETSLTRKIGLSADAVWSTVFSRKIFSLLKIFILDIIFQRRILKESVKRWSMHSLIFSAILMRFTLSLLTALCFFFNPDGEWAMALINKNNGLTAVANDLLGLFIILGVLWAAFQRFILKPDHVLSEKQDNLALLIIGMLVIVGFLLEGTRIVMTGIPSDIAVYSFMGYAVASVLSVWTLDWPSLYPYLWYAHGILGAVFVAYLPFGKMKHMINTPLTYFLEDVSGVKREKRV